MAINPREPFHEQYYNFLKFLNDTVIQSTPQRPSVDALQQETSHILRTIVFELHRQLSLVHSHLLSEDQKDVLRQTVKAIITNVHSKYGTKPASDLFERPTIME